MTEDEKQIKKIQVNTGNKNKYTKICWQSVPNLNRTSTRTNCFLYTHITLHRHGKKKSPKRDDENMCPKPKTIRNVSLSESKFTVL